MKHLWKEVQEKISKAYTIPIRVVNDQGKELLATGEFPFLYQILRNKHMHLFEKELSTILPAKQPSFICLANLHHHLYYFSGGALILGPFKQEPIPRLAHLSQVTGIEEEELLEEYNNIPIVKDALPHLPYLPELFSTINSYEQTTEKKIRKLELSARLNKIFSNNNLEQTGKELLSFLSSLFSLNNGVLLLNKNTSSVSLKPLLWSPELKERIVQVVTKSKTIHHIPCLKNDLSFSNLPEAQNITDSLLIIPILLNEQPVASILLITPPREYSREDYDFFHHLTSRFLIYLETLQQIQGMKQTAITDRLTKLYNRRHFDYELQQKIQLCQELQQPISLIFFDIDNFKFFNDTYGHIKGDYVLQELAKIITQSIRNQDIACRYGGEEFAVILPNTAHDDAKAISELLRKAVEEYSFGTLEQEKKITISLGLATCMNSSVSLSQLLQESDTALYKAKNHGKNRTESVLILDRSLSSIDVNDAMA